MKIIVIFLLLVVTAGCASQIQKSSKQNTHRLPNVYYSATMGPPIGMRTDTYFYGANGKFMYRYSYLGGQYFVGVAKGRYDYDPQSHTITFHNIVEDGFINMHGPLKNWKKPLKLLSESDSVYNPDTSSLLRRDILLGEFNLERTSNAHVLICGSYIEKVTSIKFQTNNSATSIEVEEQDWDTILDALNDAEYSKKLSDKMDEMGHPDYQLVINDESNVGVWKSKVMRISYRWCKLPNTPQTKAMMVLLDKLSRQ